MTRWIGSILAGGLLGGAVGYLLAMIELVPLPWAPIVGAFTGSLLVVGVLEVSRMYRDLVGAPEAARGAGGSAAMTAGEPPAPRPDGGPNS
jgi:hypothetical protein